MTANYSGSSLSRVRILRIWPTAGSEPLVEDRDLLVAIRSSFGSCLGGVLRPILALMICRFWSEPLQALLAPGMGQHPDAPPCPWSLYLTPPHSQHLESTHLGAILEASRQHRAAAPSLSIHGTQSSGHLLPHKRFASGFGIHGGGCVWEWIPWGYWGPTCI